MSNKTVNRAEEFISKKEHELEQLRKHWHPELWTMVMESYAKSQERQAEIVRQRLHYHFAKVGGEWNIKGMNAPFMKEFLNEVERLCALSPKTKEK